MGYEVDWDLRVLGPKLSGVFLKRTQRACVSRSNWHAKRCERSLSRVDESVEFCAVLNTFLHLDSLSEAYRIFTGPSIVDHHEPRGIHPALASSEESSR